MGNNNGKYSSLAIIGICGMLIFGTGTMIFSKMMLDTTTCPQYNATVYPDVEPWKGQNCPQYLMKKFEKPWFQTLIMFLAMALCLVFFAVEFFYNDKQVKKQAEQVSNANVDVEEGEQQPENKKIEKMRVHTWKQWLTIGIPAFFDMCATCVMTYGLELIDVSIMQMLRGAMTVFSALFNICCLKRKIRAYQWAAICVIVVALILVGVSCIMTSTGSSSDVGDTILGCVLVLCSTAIQASQIVVEDILLSNVKAYPLQVVGMEGASGAIFTLILYAIMQAIPGSDSGAVENFVETWWEFGTDGLVCGLSLGYFVCILFLNWSGMIVTQQTSSVVRTIFEAVRTAAIWVVDLMIYYWFWPNSVYGESWSTYSWIQLAGFVMLIFGSQMYNQYAKYPFFKYKFDDEEKKAPHETENLLENAQQVGGQPEEKPQEEVENKVE